MTGQLQQRLMKALVGLSILVSGWNAAAQKAMAAMPNDILEELNRVRSAPADYANWLETLGSSGFSMLM